MPSVFMISDTHFGHKKILEFESEKRPFETIEEHDETLVQNWNSVVTKRDIVYHLGDVIFSGSSEYSRLLSRLLGIKKLILGNHDSKRVKQLAPYFHSMHGPIKFEGCILTHIPIHPDQFYRFKYNIHGHLHSNLVKKFWLGILAKPDKRYINVSVEQINLTPINWEELKRCYM